MQLETEITVLVTVDYETLEKELKQNNFVKKEEYTVNDVYMIDNKIDISNMNNFDILKKCILVRNIEGFAKELLYKYKKYDDNGDILGQGKVRCPITNISKAIQFMKAINYKELFKINDKCIVYANSKSELVVQLVNDKYIFIEMENKCEFTDRVYNNIDELKEDICSYNLSIDKSNFFVKKAEMILNEIKKED